MDESQDSKDFGGRFLCFSLGSEKFAMPLLQVKEVIGYTESRSIPQSPSHFKGIMDLRGQVISVIDLRIKLKVGKPEINAETSLVILDTEGPAIAVVVDSVNSVTSFESSNISEAPQNESFAQIEAIFGVARHDKNLILLIDLKKVLSPDEVQKVKGQNDQAA